MWQSGILKFYLYKTDQLIISQKFFNKSLFFFQHGSSKAIFDHSPIMPKNNGTIYLRGVHTQSKKINNFRPA